MLKLLLNINSPFPRTSIKDSALQSLLLTTMSNITLDSLSLVREILHVLAKSDHNCREITSAYLI